MTEHQLDLQRNKPLRKMVIHAQSPPQGLITDKPAAWNGATSRVATANARAEAVAAI